MWLSQNKLWLTLSLFPLFVSMMRAITGLLLWNKCTQEEVGLLYTGGKDQTSVDIMGCINHRFWLVLRVKLESRAQSVCNPVDLVLHNVQGRMLFQKNFSFVKTSLTIIYHTAMNPASNPDGSDNLIFGNIWKSRWDWLFSWIVAIGNIIFLCWEIVKGRNGSSRLAGGDGKIKRQWGRRKEDWTTLFFFFLMLYEYFVGPSVCWAINCFAESTLPAPVLLS